MSKKVLFISYAFPPQGGVGVQRIVKFLKYLPSHGYQCYVLSAAKRFYDFKDEGLAKQLDARKIHIHRLFSFEPENYSDNFSFKNFSFKLLYHKAVRNFFRLFDFLFTPDEKSFWILPASLAGASLALKEKIDCIYATGDPFSSLLAGYYIGKLTNKPLVTDFRDEWVGGYLTQHYQRRYRWHHEAEKRMEEKIVRRSAKVITVTQSIVDNFIKKYPDQKEKFVYIPNGFDEDDFVYRGCLNGTTAEDKFIIAYTGKAYTLRDPINFLKSLKLIKQEKPEIYNKIKIVFAGEVAGSIKEEAERLGIGEILEFRGYVPYAEVMALLRRVSLNLLILDDDEKAKRAHTTKIFEYFASGKDILAIAPHDSEVAELVKKSGTGIVITDKSDIIGMRDAVYRFVGARKAGKPLFNRNYEFINQFTRKKQAEQLAQIFDDVISEQKE